MQITSLEQDVADMRFKWYQCGMNFKQRELSKVDEFLKWMATRFGLPQMEESKKKEED